MTQRVRVWAADVRDRNRPHEKVTPHLAALAGALCALLDTVGREAAGNAKASTSTSIHLLVGELILRGVKGPD